MEDLVLQLGLTRCPVPWLYSEYYKLEKSPVCMVIRHTEFLVEISRYYGLENSGTFPEFLHKHDVKYLFINTSVKYQKSRFLATHTCKQAIVEATALHQDEFVDWLVNTPLGKQFSLGYKSIGGCHDRPDGLTRYFKLTGTKVVIPKDILKFFEKLLANKSELFMLHYNSLIECLSEYNQLNSIKTRIYGLTLKYGENYLNYDTSYDAKLVAAYADKPELLHHNYNANIVTYSIMANSIKILKHIGTRGILNGNIYCNTEVIEYLLPDNLIMPVTCNNKYIRVVTRRNPEMLKRMNGLVSIKMALYIYDNNILPEEYTLKFMENDIIWCSSRRNQEPCDVWRAISILKSRGIILPLEIKS